MNNKLRLNFNIWNNNFKTERKSGLDHGLGKMRNTVGSTTRIYKHCSKNTHEPLNCTFGSTSILNDIIIDLPLNAPNILNVAPGTNDVTISFTQELKNNLPIIDYLYSIDGVNYISSGFSSSPITISGLTNGTTYNITLKAVNANGESIVSRIISFTTNTIVVPPTNTGPLAPIITGTVSKTLDSITISFTQETNSITITNYKYSIDNGLTYVAFSPIDKVSPVTISGLTSGTTYNIKLRATSAEGDGAESDVWTETTYLNVNYVSFTDVGASTWTAPDDVTEIEYLVVGGGGGGGGTYSKITVLGNILVTDTPQPGAYWINNANLTNGRYSGRLYYGNNSGQNSSSFTDPVRLTASQNFTPNGVIYPYQKWYNFEMVYLLNGAAPISTNTTYSQPQGTPTSTYSNNVSAGSGGGGGGHLKTTAIGSQAKYQVVPGTTYNVYVGAGGAGGTASTNVENKGSDGEASYFDTIVAAGGAGGNNSRTGFNQNGGGGNNNSDSIMGGKGGAAGGRNGGAVINSEAYQWNTTILRGTYGGQGAYINFDGTGNKIYGAGGDGGASNTPASGTTIANVGKGGTGTGATLNSYANGIDGGSGIVILKYYTSVVTNPPVLTYSTFTNVGTTTWTAPQNVRSVDYLVVGGGGGSGATHDGGSAGGGGGGMVLTGTLSVNPNEVYTVIVGDGGDGGLSYSSASPGPGGIRETDGSNGGSSQFSNIIALGGGNGYKSRSNGTGVGGTIVTTPNVASTGGYGGSYSNGGGGGGGNGSNGSNGVVGSTRTGGIGGSGLSSDISGTMTIYGAGGAGGKAQTSENAIAGEVNTGNGAKGPGATFASQKNGAKGGSGIVILKYYT